MQTLRFKVISLSTQKPDQSECKNPRVKQTAQPTRKQDLSPLPKMSKIPVLRPESIADFLVT